MSARLCAAVCSNSKYISRLALENCDEGDWLVALLVVAGGGRPLQNLFLSCWLVLKDACPGNGGLSACDM